MEYEKPQATIHKGPQGILTITVEVITSLFRTLKVVENTIFSIKDGNLSSEKNGPNSSQCFGDEKCRGKLHTGAECLLTVNLQVISLSA